MNRTVVTILFIAVVATGFVFAQNPADDAYIKAMTQSDPCQKVAALKSFLQQYAGKGSQYENFANAHICLTPCPGQAGTEKAQYGEKALTMEGLDDSTKTQLYVTVASLHIQSGQNLDKAKAVAGKLIEFAKANKEKDPSEAQWNKLIGAGYFLQGQAAEKAKDMSGAADAYITSYGILKDPKIMVQIKKLAKTLYDAKQFAQAEQVFRALYNHSKDADSALILGQTLYRNNKADEALALFKEAYAKKQTGELAYNIGIILAKKAPQEAIDYLIVASLRYPAQAQNALGMAQNLYFTSSPDAKINDVINKIQDKQKRIDELTKSFNTKFADKNEEELTDAEKAEMTKILADIDAVKAEIAKLQSSSSEMTGKWTKRVEEVKRRLGTS
jgi:tetratricopeptide (TPR) repeat protein